LKVPATALPQSELACVSVYPLDVVALDRDRRDTRHVLEEPTGYSAAMLEEFLRCVREARPLWFLPNFFSISAASFG
jgi:hypothetical protein